MNEKTQYIFCEKCNKNTPVHITEKGLNNMVAGIAQMMVLHNDTDPPHALVIQVDKHLNVRGIDYVESIQISNQKEKSIDISQVLLSTISMFGKNEKESIKNFSYMMMSLICGMKIHLKEGDETIIHEFKGILSEVLKSVNINENIITGDMFQFPDIIVFSLRQNTILSKKENIDTKLMEKVVKDFLSSKNYIMFKNEISKFSYAYDSIVRIIDSDTKTTKKDISDKIFIEETYICAVLSMASMRNKDVSRIK